MISTFGIQLNQGGHPELDGNGFGRDNRRCLNNFGWPLQQQVLHFKKDGRFFAPKTEKMDTGRNHLFGSRLFAVIVPSGQDPTTILAEKNVIPLNYGEVPRTSEKDTVLFMQFVPRVDRPPNMIGWVHFDKLAYVRKWSKWSSKVESKQSSRTKQDKTKN